MANLETQRIGELDCHVITTDQSPQLVAVLCHGFGAPGDDLVPLGAQLFRDAPSLLDRVQLVFPVAPLSLADEGMPHGRAWWPLDLLELNRALAAGEMRDLRNSSPPELPSARQKLTGLIGQLLQETGLPLSRLILGGFSQGAMLATETSLHLDEPPGGLAIFSGTLLNEADWKPRMGHLRGTPVVQSHGRADPILPFSLASELRDLLLTAGADVSWIEFAGPHTIPHEALRAFGQQCEQLLAD